MSNHTPGPWRIDNSWTDSYFIRAGMPDFGTDRTVVIVSKNKDEVTEHADGARTYRKKPILTADADAKLIAAAPDLLEAAQNIENDDGHIPITIWNMLQAAIEKAGGTRK